MGMQLCVMKLSVKNIIVLVVKARRPKCLSDDLERWIARQASVAMQALQYISDHQLEDVGYTRDTFVEQIKVNVLAELDAAHAKKNSGSISKSKFSRRRLISGKKPLHAT